MPQALLDGIALYEAYCKVCHFPLADGLKQDRTAEEIGAAIESERQMKNINLTAQELELIELALSSDPHIADTVMSES